MTFDLAITGGTVITEAGPRNATIAINGGKIVGILDPERTIESDESISATGKHVLPGGVDPHVHMMDPGDTHREDFTTGTAAAAVGGITTVGDQHRHPKEGVLTRSVLEKKRRHLADKARIDYALMAGGHPENVDQISDLEAAGALGFKSFTCEAHGVPALQSGDMHRLYEEIERVGGISMVHPEDELMVSAAERTIRSDGRTDGSIVPEWRSKAAEQVAVSTTLKIAEQTGVSVWFAHLSHPEVVEQVTAAKARGVSVYAESCPQYFYFTREDVIDDAPYTMFTPPARTAADRDGLWECLEAGEIDMISADHAPATREEKANGETNVFDAPFGIPGVETVLPLLLDGVASGKITLERVVDVFSTNPAKITGLYPRKGAIRIGADADLVIVDLESKRKLSNDAVVAKCGWTPFDGMTVTGCPETTLVRGTPVVKNREIVGEPGYGEFIAPTIER